MESKLDLRKQFPINTFQRETQNAIIQFILTRDKKHHCTPEIPTFLLKDHKLVRVVSTLGTEMGRFIAHKADLPYLVKVNKAPKGSIYFVWNGIKENERM